MLGASTCTVEDVGQVTGLEQVVTIFHTNALSTWIPQFLFGSWKEWEMIKKCLL